MPERRLAAADCERTAFSDLIPGAVEVTAIRQQTHSTGSSGEPLSSGQLTLVAPSSGSSGINADSSGQDPNPAGWVKVQEVVVRVCLRKKLLRRISIMQIQEDSWRVRMQGKIHFLQFRSFDL